jgi:hypothetical protein
VTISTDTIAYSDNNEMVDYLGSVAVAVTLPTATTLGNANFMTILSNLTTGSSTAVTVTPTTWTINGLVATPLVILQGQTYTFEVDASSATNWIAKGREGPLSAGSNITLTRTAAGTSVAGTSGVNLQGSAPGTQQTGNINVSGVIEADGGFSSGPTGSLLLQGLAEAAPTVTLPSIYIDSTGGIPYFLNASSVLTAEMIKGIANPSDSEVVAYVDQAGVQHRVTQSGGGSTRTWPATFAGLVQAGVAGFSANLPATNAPTPTNSGATDPVAVLDFPQGSSADYAWWWPFSSLPTGYVSNSNIAYTLTSRCKVGACDSTHATSVVLSWACSTTGPTDTPTWNATSAVNITNASSGGVKTSGTITPTCAAGSALGIKILPTTTSLTSGDSFQLVSAYFSVQGGM